MSWLAVAAVFLGAIVVHAYLVQRDYKALGAQDGEKPQAPTAEALADRVVGAAVKLRIVGKDTALLHSPIYDCASDSYELPCEALGRDAAQGIHNLGRFRGRRSMEEAARGLAELCWQRGIAHFEADHVTLVWTDDWGSAGGMVWRLVRLGPEEWFGYYWRAGMRASAGPVDPPFRVKDLRRDHALWARREAARPSHGADEAFALAAARCAHRPDVVDTTREGRI